MRIRNNQSLFPSIQGHSWVRWGRRLLFVISILSLGYVAFALIDAQLFQADQSRQFQRDLNRMKMSAVCDEPLPASSVPPASVEEDLRRAERINMASIDRAPLGRIEISAIGLTAMIMEGTDARTLRRAVGHIPGTPLPGQPGNVAITGHRDTFFRPLRNIRKDDEIRLTTLNGSYRYWVDSIRVVEPEDMDVLNKSEDSLLTIVTCYPFYYVGPAPKRFVVRARKIPEQKF